MNQNDFNEMHDEAEEILQHWGILGMKWGIRRFQNEDGTLTELGRQRYNEAYNNTADKETGAIPYDKYKADMLMRSIDKNLSDSEKAMYNEIRSATNELQKTLNKPGTYKTGKYPGLSDKELKDRIQRMQLEKQYSDLKGDTKYIKSGQEKINNVLSYVGTAAGLATSAVTIGTTIENYKRGTSPNK